MIRMNVISTNAAAQAWWFRWGSGASEYSKMITGMEAIGWLAFPETQSPKSEQVKSRGAVSPAPARPPASRRSESR